MSNGETTDDSVVRKLEEQAEVLKGLLDARSAKRPLIIEFSGSPKAGKTRSIAVLELFLKRNGIRTEVFTERASVSPIKTKGNMNFNVWVSCASLQGMLESLHKDIDVFILDRGVFDSLVWTEWLSTTGKITPHEASTISKFFALDCWLAIIDVVFVMTCSPSTSITREYAEQLTTKRGTIMQEHTLRQLKDASESTMNRYQHNFKKVVHVDTTDLRTRDGVVKITTQALQSLSQLLDETICVVPRNGIEVSLPDNAFISDAVTISTFIENVQRNRRFVPRSIAEKDVTVLQPIPCAILRFQDKILFFKRNEPGHSLHDTLVVWAGGHVLDADDHESNLLINALKREVGEEISIRGEYTINQVPVGLLRTSEDERASRHIGILYEISLSTAEVALGIDQKEFRETKGRSVSGRLVEINRIGDYYKYMKGWSQFIVDHFWPEQGTLFT